MNNTISEFQTGQLRETGTSFEKEFSKAYSAQSAVLVDALSALTVRIKAGDASAFEIFYDTSKNYVYNNIRGLSSSLSDETAQDIMQEVYIKAFSNISSLNDPQGTLKWLKTITINTTRDYFKKSSVRHESLIKEDEETSFESSVSESELMEPIEIPENIVEDSATRKIVADAVMALPEKQRMLMSEFYYNGRSIKDIAAESGMSEGAVKTQLSRARSSLKNTFLKIEKDQGIRLHSVGIIPFIFFIFYLIMQQNPVKEAVGSAVRVSVFNSELFKNAAGSALEAAGQAAQGLYKGQVTDAAAKSAKGAADSAKELAESVQDLNTANASGKAPGVSPEAASSTGKETAKAAKAASKASRAGAKASSAKAAGTAAGAAAKTAGLSAAAKGIIIGAAAAVAIGTAATTAVVVRNNNESEIIAEAESETETEGTTEEAAAEAIEETTQEVDEVNMLSETEINELFSYIVECGDAYASFSERGTGLGYTLYLEGGDGSFSAKYYIQQDLYGKEFEICYFEGRFINVYEIDDDIYSATVADFAYTYEDGTTYSENDVTYNVINNVYGFTEGDEVIIFLPGTDEDKVGDHAEDIYNFEGSTPYNYTFSDNGVLNSPLIYDTQYPDFFSR